MKITKPIIIFISATALILALIIAPKPPIVQSISAEYNRYQSLNVGLAFSYPKAWGEFKTQYPTVFESENISFSNGVSVNLGWFEGEFSGDLVREKIKSESGHDCTLYIGKAGFAPDEYMTSAVCNHSLSSKHVLVTAYNVIGLEKAQQYFTEFKSLVESI